MRGTKVVAEVAADGSTSRVALLAEEDGRVGKIMVSTDAGEELISVPNRMVEIDDKSAAPSPQREVSSAEVVDLFGTALEALPAPTQLFDPSLKNEKLDVYIEPGRREAQEARAAEPEATANAAGDAETPVVDAAAEGQSEEEAVDAAAEDGEETGDETGEETSEETGEDADAEASAEEGEGEEGEGDAEEADAANDDAENAEASGEQDASEQETAEQAAGAGAEDGAAEQQSTDPQPSEIASESNGAGDGFEAAFQESTPASRNDARSDDDAPAFAATKPSSPTALATKVGDNALTSASPATTPRTTDAATRTDALADVSTQETVETPAVGAETDEDQSATAKDDEKPNAVAAPVDPGVDADAPAIGTIADEIAEGVARGLDENDDQGAVADGVSAEDDAANDQSGAAAADTAPEPSTDATPQTPQAPDANAQADAQANASGAIDQAVESANEASEQSENASNDQANAALDQNNGASDPVANDNQAPTNAAPGLVNTSLSFAAPVNEDSATPVQKTVADLLIAAGAADADGDALGLALTGVDAGDWTVSLDGGATFQALGAVSENAALLLDASAVLQFTPAPDYNGAATLEFRAWDGTAGASGQQGVDVTANGATTAFSADLATGSLVVQAVNDAPMLSPTDFTNVSFEGAQNLLVADLLSGSNTVDVDGDALGVAIVGADAGNGSWFYDLGDGVGFRALGAVADASAVLLDDAAVLRFEPNAGYAGTAELRFRAWDQTSGQSGDSGVDATLTGGVSAFSSDSGAIDAESPLAAFDVVIVDVSTQNDLATVANGDALNLTALNSGQVSFDVRPTSASQATIGSVEITLTKPDGSTVSRMENEAPFSPFDNDASGLTGGFGAEAGDYQIQFTIFSGANGEGAVLLDVVQTFAVIDDTPNSAPLLDTAPTTTLTSIVEDDAGPLGTPVANLMSGASDVDGPVAGIAIVAVDDANGTWQISTDDGVTYTDIVGVSASNALLASDAATIRFVPAPDFNGSAGVTFHAWDGSAHAAGDMVSLDAVGGTSAFSVAAETATIDVVAVNDAPVLDTSPSPQLTGIAEDDAGSAGNACLELARRRERRRWRGRRDRTVRRRRRQRRVASLHRRRNDFCQRRRRFSSERIADFERVGAAVRSKRRL